ncbi:MAG: polyphosphate kinase 2 [Campylobacterales bacterium]|nr:polyphosphate kinase 2 [Campylobacterales bacterium]
MKELFENINLLKNNNKEQWTEILSSIENDLRLLKTKDGLKGLIGKKKFSEIKDEIIYEEELESLQIELLKLQNWVFESKKRVMIIFEGRDAAGKGGTIKRFIEHLNPRRFRVVALQKPTEIEAGQFYFQRYFAHLPNPGEIVFFDRSWYNRAIIEPVYKFCTKEQYEKFIKEVPTIENALVNDGIVLIKFWLSINKDTQKERFEERMESPLKYWKISPIDEKAQELWDDTTYYKDEMFRRTHTDLAPWVIVDSNDKKIARLESIRYVLSKFPYEDKDDEKIYSKLNSKIVEIYSGKRVNNN